MRFPETHWTLIRAAGEPSSESGQQALDRVLRRYWPVLSWHLTAHKRLSATEAEDLLQGFILDKILEQDLLAHADAGRGRFRSLVLKALDNYTSNRRRFEEAGKRAPENGPLLDLDSADGVAAADDPAASFDVGWARHVFDEAARRMRSECEESGRTDIWGVFSARELQPARSGGDPVPYELLCRRLRLPTPTHAANLLVTGKRMFRRHVEQIVCEYAADRREADAEVRDLLEIAGRL